MAFSRKYHRQLIALPSKEMKAEESIALREIDPDLHLNVPGNQERQHSPTKVPWIQFDYGENLPSHDAVENDIASILSVLQRSLTSKAQNVTSHIEQPPVSAKHSIGHQAPVSDLPRVQISANDSARDFYDARHVSDEVHDDDDDDDEDDDDNEIYYEASPLPLRSVLNYTYNGSFNTAPEPFGESMIPKHETIPFSQMKCPLLENSEPLELSSLASYPKRIEYFPFYGNIVDVEMEHDDKAVLLALWQYEFDHLLEEGFKCNKWIPSVWAFLFGGTEEEYYKKYPWCRFFYRSSNDESDESKTEVEYDVDDFINYIYQFPNLGLN